MKELLTEVCYNCTPRFVFNKVVQGMNVCKVFCPEAGSSLDMHYQGSTYLSLLDKIKE